ncbi:hypothetical protein [Aquimarina sediminis]|uniref:hypothetical protein n=1 Tax=Aquimarina sediminis TaxID=2070536 RepID=UPI000FFEC237|nr:hypothetical protein [Aquimarina sediminis]
MKTTISCIILLFLATGISAQEIKTTNQIDEIAVVTEKTIATTSTTKALTTENTIEDDMCYSEISKVTFYEALIRQNDLQQVHPKNNKLVVKTTENLITSKKNRISYSE